MRRLAIAFVVALTAAVVVTGRAEAASSAEINTRVDAALAQFGNEVSGAQAFLGRADGVLIFPEIIKAGFGIGGEYGEGALRVGGSTVEYYSSAAASIGLQFGAQAKTVILVFLDESALKAFRASNGWEAGVDGSVALIEWGAGKELEATKLDDPIVGFVFSNKGLMYNLTLEGSKYTKIQR